MPFSWSRSKSIEFFSYLSHFLLFTIEIISYLPQLSSRRKVSLVCFHFRSLFVTTIIPSINHQTTNKPPNQTFKSSELLQRSEKMAVIYSVPPVGKLCLAVRFPRCSREMMEDQTTDDLEIRIPFHLGYDVLCCLSACDWPNSHCRDCRAPLMRPSPTKPGWRST